MLPAAASFLKRADQASSIAELRGLMQELAEKYSQALTDKQTAEQALTRGFSQFKSSCSANDRRLAAIGRVVSEFTEDMSKEGIAYARFKAKNIPTAYDDRFPAWLADVLYGAVLDCRSVESLAQEAFGSKSDRLGRAKWQQLFHQRKADGTPAPSSGSSGTNRPSGTSGGAGASESGAQALGKSPYQKQSEKVDRLQDKLTQQEDKNAAAGGRVLTDIDDLQRGLAETDKLKAQFEKAKDKLAAMADDPKAHEPTPARSPKHGSGKPQPAPKPQPKKDEAPQTGTVENGVSKLGHRQDGRARPVRPKLTLLLPQGSAVLAQPACVYAAVGDVIYDCSGQGNCEKVYGLASRSQTCEIICLAVGRLTTMQSRIRTVRTKDQAYEIIQDPSELPDLHLLTAEQNELVRANPCNDFCFSDEMMKRLIKVGPNWMYNPCIFNDRIRQIYDSVPIFSGQKVCLSTGSIIDVLAAHIDLAVPLNRITSFIQKSIDRRLLSRSNWDGLMNSVCRAFLYPLSKAHQEAVRKCTHIRTDESPLVVQAYRIETGKDKSQLYCIMTGYKSEIQGVYFMPSSGRGTEDFLRAIGIDPDNPHQGDPPAIRSVGADQYVGYVKAVKFIKNVYGADVERCGCWAHLRRKFTELMKSLQLDELFEQLSGELFTDFEPNLAAYQAQAKNKLTTVQCEVMRIVLLINMVFHLERDAEFEPNDEILERRQSSTSVIVREIINRALYIALETKCVPLEYDRENSCIVRVGSGGRSIYAAAIGYCLRSRESLRAFLSDPEACIDNSAVERQFRRTTLMKHGRILQTHEGAMSYCALLTVASTCDINGVDFRAYLSWVIANVKLLIYQGRTDHKLRCYQPRPKKNDAGKLLKIYDKDYSCVYDDLPWKELTVWKYKEALLKDQGLA